MKSENAFASNFPFFFSSLLALEANVCLSNSWGSARGRLSEWMDDRRIFISLMGHHYGNMIHYLCWDAEASGRFSLHALTSENLFKEKWSEVRNVKKTLDERKFLPLDVNFFVLMILAANSRFVDFWTHLFTIENAPLRKKEKEEEEEKETLMMLLNFISRSFSKLLLKSLMKKKLVLLVKSTMEIRTRKPSQVNCFVLWVYWVKIVIWPGNFLRSFQESSLFPLQSSWLCVFSFFSLVHIRSLWCRSIICL